ncbi:MAG: SRPBCC family protein [Gemmatimonadota bacterium]
MPLIQVSSSAEVGAPPSIVYGLIADYRVGHPSILPPKYFQNLRVEEGGVGAGTRISFDMRLGRLWRLQAYVTEPESGRQLCEHYPDTGMVTTFTVDPANDGRHSLVTITTCSTKPGLPGWFEHWLMPRYLRPIFAAELQQLDGVARARLAGPPPG